MLNTDLDVTVGDGLRHQFTHDNMDLVLDLIVDTKSLEQPRVIRTRAAVRMADRFGVEHRLFETFHGADIRFGRARLHSNAITGTGELDHRANHFGVLDQIVECGDEVDYQVAWRIVLNLLVRRHGTAEIDHDLAAGRFLIAACEIAHAGHRALTDDNREFGRLCRRGGPCGQRTNKCDHGDKCAFHDILQSLPDFIANGVFMTETAHSRTSLTGLGRL